jgi:hypothetical protein
MSFFRFRQHGTNFAEPAEAQKATLVTALSVAHYSLLKATILHFNSTPERHDRFDPEEVKKMTGNLQQWKAHFEAG